MANSGKSASKLGGARAWMVVGCGSFFYCYQFIIRVFPNVLTEEIMQAFAIDAAAFGFIIGFFYWGYSGMQIPLGITMDKFGPRLLLSAAGFMCGLGCFVFASTSDPYLAGAARLAMGMGSACGFLGTIKLGTLWLPPHQIGKVIAMTITLGTIGAALGGSPLSLLTDAIGWHESLYGLGLVGCGLGVLTFIIVRNSPDGTSPTQNPQGDSPIFAGLRDIILSPQAWLISFFGMLMYAPLIIMGDAWCTPFIETVYPINETVAATLGTSLFIGAAVGAPFFTSLSDRLVSRLTPMLIGAVGSLIVYMIIIFWTGIPLAVMYALFFAGGFCYTAKALCFACMTEIAPPSASGVSVGFTNMIVMIFGTLLHPLVGYMVNSHWNGLIIDDSPVYSEMDYRFAFVIIPICLAISLFLIGFMRETHPGRKFKRLRRR